MSRQIYNAALAQRKEAWEKEKRAVTRVEQQAWLKEASVMWNRLKEIYAYREMLLNLVAKELRARYKGSVLGFF